ncbi:MAG: phosphate/phosphite/phosphonate ABC transporter substrate-binding protein [Zoogloeaceae bacterium]|jgi:phosphonate transport system substrate-binding protein|nr:phosphate/phosphite/phosphonate ABC transporter substrate-binding protein [Zoogloeaceae bacterium]
MSPPNFFELKHIMLRHIFSVLALAALSACSATAAQEAPLRLGIAPFNSPADLFRAHRPLAQHLERSLNRPVKILSSKDHAAFLRDSLRKRFDILITPPHFGALCLQYGFVPLARYKAPFKFIFVVRADSAFKHHRDLRGKRIAFPDYASFFAQAGIKNLAENGMKADTDYQMLDRPSHAAAMAAVVAGNAEAAVTTFAPLNLAHHEIRSKLRIINLNDLNMDDHTLPHLMTLADNHLDAALIERIRKALQRFPATGEGKAFFAASGYEGYVPISPQDIKSMQPYVEMIRQQPFFKPPVLPDQERP